MQEIWACSTFFLVVMEITASRVLSVNANRITLSVILQRTGAAVLPVIYILNMLWFIRTFSVPCMAL